MLLFSSSGVPTDDNEKSHVFSAWPIEGYWRVSGRYSFNYGVALLVFTSMDLILDLIILTLPLPLIKRLKITSKQKWMLVGLLWLGLS